MRQNLKLRAIQYGGYCNFDFDQTQNAGGVYNLIVTQNNAPAARSGLCCSLCMLWLSNLRISYTQAYAPFITNNTQQQTIQAYTNWMFQAGNQWEATMVQLMTQQLSFNYVQQKTVNLMSITSAVLYSKFAILGYYDSIGNYSHATAFRVFSQSIYFFDPNEGEVFFKDRDDFFTFWFIEYLKAVLPGQWKSSNYKLYLFT